MFFFHKFKCFNSLGKCLVLVHLLSCQQKMYQKKAQHSNMPRSFLVHLSLDFSPIYSILRSFSVRQSLLNLSIFIAYSDFYYHKVPRYYANKLRKKCPNQTFFLHYLHYSFNLFPRLSAWRYKNRILQMLDTHF